MTVNRKRDSGKGLGMVRQVYGLSLERAADQLY